MSGGFCWPATVRLGLALAIGGYRAVIRALDLLAGGMAMAGVVLIVVKEMVR